MHENFKNSHTNSNVTKTAIVRPLMLILYPSTSMPFEVALKHLKNVIAQCIGANGKETLKCAFPGDI